MNKKEELRLIRIGIISSFIGGVAVLYWKLAEKNIVNFFSWIWTFLKSLWEWLLSPHEVYGWVLVLLVILSIITLIRIIYLILHGNLSESERLYKSDHLFGVDWSWRYGDGAIENLWCFCPHCNNELVFSEFEPNYFNVSHDGMEPETRFICDRCETNRCTLKGNKEYALKTVKREIQRKIRNNEWQNNSPT